MTAEQVKPVTWRISSENPPHALRTLQAAEQTLAKRTQELNKTRLNRWPGFELRIYASGGSRLIADLDHGKEIEKLTKRILRDGNRARVRLEIDW